VAKPGDEERVSAQTLERLRTTFLSTASYGSVYDNYTLSSTLGAFLGGSPARVRRSDAAWQARGATRW